MRRISRLHKAVGLSTVSEAIRPVRTASVCRLPATTATSRLAFSTASALRTSTPALVVPGAVETAPRPGSVIDAAYTPAESGDGLEQVGGLDGWWDEDAHWNAAALEFRGFGPATRVTDPATLEVLARQAVLEAVAVQQSGLQGEAGTVGLTAAWRRGGAAARMLALGLDVDTVAADGQVTSLRGDVAGVVSGLRGDDAEAASDADADVLPAADEARALVEQWDVRWKAISLADPALKFAVAKRILQLTGHMLPDAQLATADTVAGLLAVLVTPPKPKKLAEALQADGTLAALPNVAVFGRRVTPIDKHKMVGRWKVIVEELEKRDLPVTGTGQHDKSVERKWVYR